MKINDEEIFRLPPPKLKPVEETVSGYKLSLWQKLSLGFAFIIIVPKFVILIVKAIWSATRQAKNGGVESADSEDSVAEIKAALKYQEVNQTLEIKLNQRGLEVFIEAIDHAYKNSSGYQMGAAFEIVSKESNGWHTHSEFWWPDSEHELTIGTGDTDKLVVHSGDWISANSKAWKKFADELKSIRGQMAILVLDANDEEWCSTESTGRIILIIGSLD